MRERRGSQVRVSFCTRVRSRDEKGRNEAGIPRPGDRTSLLKHRVHVRLKHRDVETSPVDAFIRPPLDGLIIYASSRTDLIVGTEIGPLSRWNLFAAVRHTFV